MIDKKVIVFKETKIHINECFSKLNYGTELKMCLPNNNIIIYIYLI